MLLNKNRVGWIYPPFSSCMDLSSFLIFTATQRAKDVIKEDNLLTLSKEEWKHFESSISSSKKPTKALKELMNLESFDD